MGKSCPFTPEAVVVTAEADTALQTPLVTFEGVARKSRAGVEEVSARTARELRRELLRRQLV
jgi:hypothetical protein